MAKRQTKPKGGNGALKEARELKDLDILVARWLAEAARLDREHDLASGLQQNGSAVRHRASARAAQLRQCALALAEKRWQDATRWMEPPLGWADWIAPVRALAAEMAK